MCAAQNVIRRGLSSQVLATWRGAGKQYGSGDREKGFVRSKNFLGVARARATLGWVDGWPDDTDVLRMLYRYKTIGYLVLDSQLSLMPFRFRLFASWTRIPTVERRSGCSSHSIARTKGAICRPTLFTARVTAALDPCHVHVK